MRPDRQLAHLMAAMIVMIIAYVAPSAVQAHETHAHHGHHHAEMAQAHSAPLATEAKAAAAQTRAVQAPAKPWAVVGLPAKAVEPAASIRANDTGGGCCPTGCRGSCCGTVACCASGILSGPASLAVPAFRPVTLIPHDVDGRSGLGPEALPKPPRTLA